MAVGTLERFPRLRERALTLVRRFRASLFHPANYAIIKVLGRSLSDRKCRCATHGKG